MLLTNAAKRLIIIGFNTTENKLKTPREFLPSQSLTKFLHSKNNYYFVYYAAAVIGLHRISLGTNSATKANGEMESVKNGKVGEGKWSKFAERRREDERGKEEMVCGNGSGRRE